MLRRIPLIVLLGVLVVMGVACGKNKAVKNPLAQVDSKQPDKVLFDRAMDAMKSRKYDVARLSLQTMINAYPDSEYLSRAKLAIGDSWYYEGTSAAWSQAENEYKDYQTFFPNTPEAAEAQLRVAEIHYKQMEKPDRDYTHALRAEDEFRQLILQYPDSKLVDQARKELLQVQEVLAEREYRVGRFYFVKESYPASVARLKSLTDAYPLFSQADEALFLQGQALEAEANLLRAVPKEKLGDGVKNKLLKDYEDQAAEAYSKIVTRYPVMTRAEDAKQRLAALDRPIPKPTEDAIAMNKKEEESRSEVGRMSRIMGNFKKKPDISMAAATTVGQPTLTDPKPVDASLLVRGASDELAAGFLAEAKKNNKVSVETVAPGAKVPPNQAPPRSDAPQNPDQAAPAPEQVNEAGQNAVTASPVTGAGDNGAAQTNAAGSETPKTDAAASSATTGTTDTKDAAKDSKKKDEKSSSSKEKKKKGLRKMLPF
jgi:outer membrane protein assembly factor BamD